LVKVETEQAAVNASGYSMHRKAPDDAGARFRFLAVLVSLLINKLNAPV
jgi:hypothetical protein